MICDSTTQQLFELVNHQIQALLKKLVTGHEKTE